MGASPFKLATACALAGLLTLPALQAWAQELEVYRPADPGAARSELPKRANFPQPEPEPVPQVNTNVLPEPEVNLLDPEPKADTQKQDRAKPEPADPPVSEAAVQPSAPAATEPAVNPAPAPETDVVVPVPETKPQQARKRQQKREIESAPIGEIPVVGVEIGGDEAAVAAEPKPNWDDKDLDRK